MEGRPYSGRDDLEQTDYGPATTGYFRAVGIPLVHGRLFEPGDVGDASVVLVSESTAARFWPGRNAVGRTLIPGGPESGNAPVTVIGVVGDVRHYGPRGRTPNQLYFHYSQLPLGGTVVVKAARGNPLDLLPSVRSAIARLSPAIAVYGVATLDDLLGRGMASERAVAGALAFFAFIALVLTLFGVYGVVDRVATQRKGEMAIRAALGATRPILATGLVRSAMGPVLAGLAAGIVLALAGSRLLAGLLYRVMPADPATYALVGGGVAVTALAAAVIPSLRMMRLDPCAALRSE